MSRVASFVADCLLPLIPAAPLLDSVSNSASFPLLYRFGLSPARDFWGKQAGTLKLRMSLYQYSVYTILHNRIHYTAPHHGRLLCELRTVTHTAYSQLGGRSILSGRSPVNYILSLIQGDVRGP